MFKEVLFFEFPNGHRGEFPFGRPVQGNLIYTVDKKKRSIGVTDVDSYKFFELPLGIPQNVRIISEMSVGSERALYILIKTFEKKTKDMSGILYKVNGLDVERICSIPVTAWGNVLQRGIDGAYLIDIDFDGVDEFVFTSFKKVFIVEDKCIRHLFDFTGYDRMWRIMDMAVDPVDKIIYTTFIGRITAGRRTILAFNQRGEFIEKHRFGSILSRLDILTETFLVDLIRKDGDMYLFLFNNPKSKSIFAVKNLSRDYYWYIRPYTYPGVFLDVDDDGEEELFLVNYDLVLIDDIFKSKPKPIKVKKKYTKTITMRRHLVTDGERIYLIKYTRRKWTLHILEPEGI